VLAVSLAAAACEKSNPATPSATGAASPTAATVTDASTGVTIGAPQPVSPADGAQFKNVQQPVTLTVSNGISTGSTPLSYTFEVAADSGFGSVVYRRENVGEGGNGSTSLTIDKIGPDRKYYWRVRGNPGGVAGPNSRVRSFTIGPEVILQTPVIASPAQNSTVTGQQVSLSVNNVGRSGPASTIFYKFEVSTTSSFASVIFSTTVAEQGDGRTTVTLPTVQAVRGTYFWRVQASDPENQVTTSNSAVVSFVYEPFSLSQAIILNNPGDLASWQETTRITQIDMSEFVVVDFDKRQSPDRWPESGFGSGGIQYTLGMCFNLGGQWYCSAAIQFWNGRELEAGGRTDEVGINWFYDARWGPMAGHQPAPGEIVGIFVAQGNLRDNGKTSVKERSNVVLVPFGSVYSAP